jgi:hydroxymethylbilane synthase
MKRVYVVGTRGSVLALKQAEQAVRTMAMLFPSLAFHIKKVGTEENEPCTVSLPGKGSFVKKLQESLLEGDIDVAVHSLKDMPVTESGGTEIAAYLKRGDPRDILVSASGKSLDELPRNAVIGTSSMRRTLQLMLYREDLRVRPLRGNVDTRLAKVLRGDYDAAILAAAGMARLKMEDRIAQYLPIDRFIPSAGQGIVAL